MSDNVRTCTVCGNTLSLDKFTFWISKSTGRTHYKGKCKQCVALLEKVKRKQNPEEARRKARERYASDPGKQNEYRKRWARNNPDKVRAASRRAYWKDREKHIAYAQAKRAKRVEVQSLLSSSEIALRYRQQWGKCFYCQTKLSETTDKKGCVDHWIPLAKGGKNELRNIVMACRSCNGRKWCKMPWEFMPDRFSPTDLEPTI